MDLYIDGEKHPMLRGDNEWWRLEYPTQDGDDYGFCLDGGDPLPDPRSAWQPSGVHGLSRLVDHAVFRWTDDGWHGVNLEDVIIYEMHIGTFSPEGTFDGAMRRLDHIAELGATIVELMPVVEFAGDRGWGYDGVDIFAPHHAYGGPSGLKRLVNECHARGLGVIMDVVYNHIGAEGNHLHEFGPYITDNPGTLWGDSLDLTGAESAEVRKFVVDNAAMWIRDYHCDGLRVDAIHALRWDGAIDITKDICNVVHGIGARHGRRTFVVAEDDVNDSSVVLPPAAGGLGFDAVYANTFQRALQATLTGERSGHYTGFEGVRHLVDALHRPWVYAGQYSQYAGGIEAATTDVDPARFVVYMQNHDQVGNREQGERISHLTSTGLVKIGAALTLLSPFTPAIFQGEEFSASSPFLFFTDRRELNDPHAVLQGRIDEFAGFGWDNTAVPDPQDPDSFTRSRLPWSELNNQEQVDILGWYRSLTALRRRFRARNRRFNPRLTMVGPNEGWLRVVRHPIAIVVNFTQMPVVVPLFPGAKLLLSSVDEAMIEAGNAYLPREGVIIVETFEIPM